MGARIRDARVARGLTQAHLADALKLPRSAISLIESEDRKLSAHELITIAAMLNVSLGMIVAAMPDDPFELGRQAGRKEGWRDAMKAMQEFASQGASDE